MLPAGRREAGVKELLFGGGPRSGSSLRVEVQQRQQEYAAELRAQVAAKEEQRQSERASSLRQSVALLQLRQAASSAVLPAGVAGGAGSRGLYRCSAAGAEQQLPQPTHYEGRSGVGAGLPPQRNSLPHLAGQEQAPWGNPSVGYPPQGTKPSVAVQQQPSQAQQQHCVGSQQVHAGPPGGWVAGPSAVQMQAGTQPNYPPYDTDQHRAGAQQQGPTMHHPSAWNPPVVQVPSGNDLQPLMPASRWRSWGDPGPPPGLAPWAAPLPTPDTSSAAPSLLPRPSSVRASADGGGALAAIGAACNVVSAREAEELKRAAYKAELGAQMQLKQERQRQEKMAEQAEEVRQFQAQAQPAEPVGGPIHAQAAGGSTGGSTGGIPAHWGPKPATLASSGWVPQAVNGQVFPGQQQQQQQQDQMQQRLFAPSPPSGQAGWAGQQPQAQQPMPPQQLMPPDAGWPPCSQQDAPYSSRSHQISPSAGQPVAPPPSHPSGPTAPPAAHSAAEGSRQGGGFLTVPTLGDGSQQMTGRLRSDRPYVSAIEAEQRTAQQAEFKEGLRQQMEEKTRQRAEEQQRRKAEEAAEEARLALEQERIRQQFAEERAKHKAKQAEKQEWGGETSKSGGITIKFKPPPAGKQQQQTGSEPAGAAARRGSAAAGGLERTEMEPGIDIRVKGRPPGLANCEVEAGRSRVLAPEQAMGGGAGQVPVPAVLLHPGGGPELPPSADIGQQMAAGPPPHQAPPGLPTLLPAWQLPPGVQLMAAGGPPVQQPWAVLPPQAVHAHASLHPGAPGWGQHAAHPYRQPIMYEQLPWTSQLPPGCLPYSPTNVQLQPLWLQPSQQQVLPLGGGPLPLHQGLPWSQYAQHPYTPASLTGSTEWTGQQAPIQSRVPLFQTSSVLNVRDSYADRLPSPAGLPRVQGGMKPAQPSTAGGVSSSQSLRHCPAEASMAGMSTFVFPPTRQQQQNLQPPPQQQREQQRPSALPVAAPSQRQHDPQPLSQLPTLASPPQQQPATGMLRHISWRKGGARRADESQASPAAQPSVPPAENLMLWDQLFYDVPFSRQNSVMMPPLRGQQQEARQGPPRGVGPGAGRSGA